MVEATFGDLNIAQYASTAFDYLVIILLWVIGIAIAGIIAYYVWRELQYKYLATVHYVDTEDKPGFIKFEKTVKARMLKKANKLQLKYFNAKIDIPESNAWKRSGKTWKTYLQHDGVRMFAPSIPRYNSPLTFTPTSYQVVNNFIDEGKGVINRHTKSNWWTENKSAVIFFTALAFAVVVVLMALDNAQKIAEQMFSAASANREALLNAGKQAIQSAEGVV